MAFGRSAPVQLVAGAIESMTGDLVDAVIAGFGSPRADEEQLEAPWACTGCGSRLGFRRRGFPPEVPDVPSILLLDGTAKRAGTTKGGVALHLAIGLVARRRAGHRVSVEARLLGATLGEGWAVMGDLLAGVTPGLILLDGEEELSDLAAERFPGVPVQRCLWHLGRGVYQAARYTDRASHELAGDFVAQLEKLLTAAYRDHDLDAARAAYADLIEDAEACGARAAASHLRAATDEVFTFLTHPGAGRLLFGDKGRPELVTGVLERVMREMNRRTDVGVRWSIPGARALLLVKLQRKYAHGPWSRTR